MTFGENLKRLRQQKGMTQQDVADILGVSRPTVAGYETKGKQPDYDKLRTLSSFFNISIDEMLGNTIEDNSNNSKDTGKYSEEEIQYAREFTEKLGYMGSHGVDLSDFTDEQLVEFVYELESYAQYLKLKNK